MNEELLTQLAEAMKSREKAQNGVARWQAQLNDANEDIAELSARIAGGLGPDEDEEDAEEVLVIGGQASWDGTYSAIQEPATQE